jgi:hypothetical protein
MNASAMTASQPFAEADIGRGKEKQSCAKRKIDNIKHSRLLLEISAFRVLMLA